MKSGIILASCLCLLIGFHPLIGQNYQLQEWVIDEGGVEATSAGYIANGSFHQTTIGYATGGGYVAWIGFWHPRPRWTSTHDVAAVRIVAPIGAVDTLSPITPMAEVANYGNTAEYFQAIFSIRIAGGVLPIYQNGKPVHLEPGERQTVSFVPVTIRSLGPHIARCSVALASDTNRANDTVSAVFKVLSEPPKPVGWLEMASVPAPPSGRGVQAGGFIAVDEDAGLIFVAKGNKSSDFYSYNQSQTPPWTTLAEWPVGLEGRKPGKGANGCADGTGSIYAVKGNNTLGFWRYDRFLNEWQQLPDVPYGRSHRKIKDGSDVVYVNQDGIPYIYLLKGYRNEFYRYNTLAYQWEELAPAPGLRKWDRGSWLVYDGTGTIYAHKGKYHEFYAYDVAHNEWLVQPLIPMPISSPKMLSRKKSKDGGCATWAYSSIFALKGGNTCEFWRYLPDGDSWVELDTMPSVGSTGSKKRVRYGADIGALFGELYALKGNKTLEFWRFVPGTEIVNPANNQRSGVAGRKTTLTSGPSLKVRNPAPGNCVLFDYNLGSQRNATLELFDVSGRLITSCHLIPATGSAAFTGIKPGVYVVRLNAGTTLLTRKVIVTP